MAKGKAQVSPLKFFSLLKWIDRRPLRDVIEPYRKRMFEQALFTLDDGRPRYNLALMGRAKKNWKSADLILAALYRLLAWISEPGNQCYILANDLDQADDDLELAKKLVNANSVLAEAVQVKQRFIERNDSKGFLEILPAGDVAGSHGKTYLFAGFDEIHEYRTWDLLEAMQLDPTRTDALMWITSYASIYHKPGVPLFDLCAAGWKGGDPRMVFSWYASDRTTDPDFEHALPEDRANPSRYSWEDGDYLEQQQRRLPAHKYRRLHLNLPGLPEGAAFSVEKVMDAIERGTRLRWPESGTSYVAFVDMSGGSNDDAVLAIAHKDNDGKAILDRLVDQGSSPPFNPMLAVERFVRVLREYGCASLTGDNYAGQTFAAAFIAEGINYSVSERRKSELYEALEPTLNTSSAVLLDEPRLESQLLGLIWRGGKIDHPPGEHDDFSNAAAGAVDLALRGECSQGSYFSTELVKAHQDQRIGAYPYHAGISVDTWWGVFGDVWGIWFSQGNFGEFRLIDYLELSGVSTAEIARAIKERRYIYHEHHIPAEMEEEWSDGRSRKDILEDLLRGVFEVLPKASIDEMIDCARRVIGRCRFDSQKCRQGIASLNNFRRVWSQTKEDFGAKPALEPRSVGALAFLAFALGTRHDDGIPTRETKVETNGVYPWQRNESD